MLLGNISRRTQNPIQFSGYFGANERNMLGGVSVSTHLLKYSSINKKASIPYGYTAPYSWSMAIKPGGLGLTGEGLSCQGTIASSNLAGGFNITSDLSGSGTINTANPSALAWLLALCAGVTTQSFSGALGALLNATVVGNTLITAYLTDGIIPALLEANLASNSTFTGQIAGGLAALANLYGISTSNLDLTDGVTRINIAAAISAIATLQAEIEAVVSVNIGANISSDSNLSGFITGVKWASSNLNGTGDIVSSLKALARLTSDIISNTSFSNALLNAKAGIEANITPFTPLSPESLAANVWNSVAAEFNKIGTMGNKLNLASSGGIDYNTLANAVWESLSSTYTDPDTIGGIINILQEKLTEIHKIQGLDIDNPMTVTPSIRTSGDIVLNIDGDGKTLSIVSRQ